jgi:hypothetical protein
MTMRMLARAGAIGLVLGAGVAARAQDTAVAAPAAAVKADDDKQICKRVATTGSRIGGQRVCKSAAAWDDDARAAQAATREVGRVRGGTKGQ